MLWINKNLGFVQVHLCSCTKTSEGLCVQTHTCIPVIHSRARERTYIHQPSKSRAHPQQTLVTKPVDTLWHAHTDRQARCCQMPSLSLHFTHFTCWSPVTVQWQSHSHPQSLISSIFTQSDSCCSISFLQARRRLWTVHCQFLVHYHTLTTLCKHWMQLLHSVMFSDTNNPHWALSETRSR